VKTTVVCRHSHRQRPNRAISAVFSLAQELHFSGTEPQVIPTPTQTTSNVSRNAHYHNPIL